MTNPSLTRVVCACLTLLAGGNAAHALGPGETILHSFLQLKIPGDGEHPETSMVLGKDGNFYGTTYDGGSGGNGTVYRLTPTGVVTILHSFGDATVAHDGIHPLASLIQGKDGNFYGTTVRGGTANDGTVFRMTPNGGVTILRNFEDGKVTSLDGALPSAGLVQGKDGNFYGLTESGGYSNQGTMFKMTPGGTFKIVHIFGDGSVANDAAFPATSLVLGSDGAFYGTTRTGGAGDHGTVFKATTTTASQPMSKITILHSFGDGSVANDGVNPEASLIQAADGKFYGTTRLGGTKGQGTVFRVTNTTPAVTRTLYSFQNGTDGAAPLGPLVQGTDGNFYGTTSSGGGVGSAFAYGTVFRVTASGTETILHRYPPGGIDGAGNLGGIEAGLVQGTDGRLYGATYSFGPYEPYLGGNLQYGTLFQMTTTGLTYKILHAFQEPASSDDGQNPYAGVTEGPDGNFYGTTDSGGSRSAGTAYRVTPTGTASIVHSFDDARIANDGYHPEGELVQGADGKLYGTTLYGGGTGGTIFKFTTGGQYGFLVFNAGASGLNSPIAGMTVGSDGNFYGTSNAGGSAGLGSVYKITKSGTVTTLHSFGDGSVAHDGSRPVAELIEGAGGNFYGTTQSGGVGSAGTVFQITPAGGLTILHDFGSGKVSHDGATPLGCVAQGTDRAIYGTTSAGGSKGKGIVFKVTTGGSYRVLHHFADGSVANDGATPMAGLVRVTDGNFCGTTYAGGSTASGGNPGNGTLFEITPAGALTVLHSFGDGMFENDGLNPSAKLHEIQDNTAYYGDLMGTTRYGGEQNYGTVFRWFKIIQVLVYPAIPDHLISDPPFTVNAGSNLGLPVTLSVVSGPATIAGSKVTLTGAPGTVMIQAFQPGDVATGPAKLTRSFAVR